MRAGFDRSTVSISGSTAGASCRVFSNPMCLAGRSTPRSATKRSIERLLFQRDLTTFEAIVDRLQMQIRRQMVVQVAVDPPTKTWWRSLHGRGVRPDAIRVDAAHGEQVVATATFRNMELTPVAAAGPSV